MGLKTKIEYVSATHNFWYGCTKISEGCKNCFAERMYKRFWGKDFSKIVKSKNFDAPLKWKKPQLILVNDMSDFFHKDVPFNWFDEAIEIMASAHWHTFLLLTKRANNLKKLFKINELKNNHIPNIWLGVSVENQKTADERIPELLKIPHFKKWISFEPMLDSIKIAQGVDWVVCGGETGKGARFMKPEWAIRLKEQCWRGKIPFFMKQMSNKAPIPKDLQVREYPTELKEIKK